MLVLTENIIFKPETKVIRKSDDVLGIILKFVHRFGTGTSAYNAYYVRWADGKLGMPNEMDFDILS